MTEKFEPQVPRDFKNNAYREFLRNRRFFETFVRHFVELGRLRKVLSFSEAELLEETALSERLHKSHRDLSWQVPAKTEKALFVFLIEHQTGVQHTIAARLLFYATSFWQKHLLEAGKERERRDFKFPLLFPIVFYTGPGPWKAPIDFADLLFGIEYLPERFVKFKYILVDLLRLPAEDLLEMDLLVGPVLVMGQLISQGHYEGDLFARALARLSQIQDKEELAWLKGILYHSLLAAGLSEEAEAILKAMARKEVRDMTDFSRLGEVIKKTGWEEGRAVGLKEGMEKGRLEGEAEVLLRQLERKFGPVGPEIRKRLSEATPEKLLTWAERILTAEKIEEVFGN